jgi:hypothetical protein
MPGRIPLPLKLAVTAWMVVWVPVYAHHYGAANFLWISDVAVFLTFVAVWTGSRLLASSQLVGVLLINVGWTIDVGVALLTGVHPIGGTEYMFDGEWPLYLRLLSLFHVWVPLVLAYLVMRIGYTGRGVLLQTGIIWILLPATYLLTPAEHNINWVRGPFGEPQEVMVPGLYLLVTMAAYPLAFVLGHLVVRGVQRLVRSA